MAGKAKTTQNVPHSRQIVAKLKEMIVNNELPAGATFLESELAEMVGVSRTPVREAIISLEAQGLVKSKPRRGIRILGVSANDMQEIYQLLTELEALAAELAAGKGHDEAELEEAEAAITAMDEALAIDDREAWAEADDKFHAELIRLSGNARLQNVVQMYIDQSKRVRLLTLYLRPAPVQSNKDHRAVLDAIRNGDAEGAKVTHRRHRVQAGKMLIDLLRTLKFAQM